MNKRLLAILSITSLILLLSALLAACGGSTDPQDTSAPAGTLDGKALVEERCTQCHNLDRVTSTSKTNEEWQANVERMVNTGAKLSAEEQSVVIEYLAEMYP
ncbi:MAG: hypothetical protein AB8I69_13515 [Anaerolineae bacterium]